METDLSVIVCIADIHIISALDQCLSDLALPLVFVHHAKQISLIDKQRFLGLQPVTSLEENRALLYRLYVPTRYETGIMQRIIEATDLKMGGRGCIFARTVHIFCGTQFFFDTDNLDRLCGKTENHPPHEHALISCTISRGVGESLAHAILELGVCVPVVFFGSGVGLRDKLGLLRITIPVEKEIIWFVVPRSDAELIERNLIPRARLDIPGQGFLYSTNVRAPVVNLRVRQGKRLHAATMEQVIAALDEVRGSSDWRRLGSRKSKSTSTISSVNTRGIFFVGEDDEVETFRKMAMANGARGATLNALEMRSYSAADHHEQGMVSHSRQLCDIITSPEIEKKILNAIAQSDLLNGKSTCVLQTFNVETPSVIRSSAPVEGNA